MFRSIGFSILSIVILHAIHWMSALFYGRYCIATGFHGYFYSFLTTASPICKALMEIQYQSIRVYDATLIGMSIFLTHQIEKIVASASPRPPRPERPTVIPE